MAGHGNEELKPEVQRAVQAGTDLSQGSDKAYDALMREVSQAQQKYGNDSAGFDKFGQAVAKGLERNGTLEEMSEQFAKHNIKEVATSDEKHVKAADMNPQFGTNALEKAFLSSLSNNYGDLQQRAGTTFFGNPKDEFSGKDFQRVLDSRQHDRDTVENQRLAQEAQGREQAKFNRVTGDLFKNDGNPNHSLYAVLDGVKSGAGNTDGKISHGDLKRYQEDYAVRAARGDFGFNKENLDTVRTLDREWNKPLGLALRGTSPQAGERSGNQDQPNYAINLKAAGEAMHRPADQLFAAYSPQGAGADRQGFSRVSGDGQNPTGSAALPDVGDIPPAPPIPRDGNGQVVRSDARTAAAPPQPAQGYDANGNPVGGAAGAPMDIRPPAQAGGAAPQRRDVGADGRPVPVAGGDRQAPGPNSQRRAPGSAYDEYFGDGRPQGAPQGPGGEAPHRRRQAPAGQGGDAGAGAPPAGADRQAPAGADAQPHRRVAAAAAGPDLSSVTELKMPEVKAGDDPAKVLADFQKAATDHFSAASRYNVQPGQGWDRIARDATRKTGGDPSNEQAVEKLSDQLAKLNGAQGRLDKSLMLHPNDVVRLHDDAWVKAQVDAAMNAFNQKITDATKPAGPAGAAPGGDSADLFSGARSGEGDVTAPPKAAAVPGDKGTAAAPPAPGADKGTAAAPPAPGADKGTAAAPPAPGADKGTAAAPPAAGADKGTAAAAPPAVDISNPGTADIEARANAQKQAAADKAAADKAAADKAAADKAAAAAKPAPAVGAGTPPPGQTSSSGGMDISNLGNPL